MRKKIVAGNWKMNNDLNAGLKLTSEIINMVKDEVSGDTSVVLAPSYVLLSQVGKLIGQESKISLGAQNVSQFEKGAFTGEISVEMLASVGVRYVIIGHSERRQYFNETNAELGGKVDRVLENGMTPIFCCGEPLGIRESGNYIDYVTIQLENSLQHLTVNQMKKMVIAYEPIWAIGTGKTASADQAQEMHEAIRDFLSNDYSEVSDEIPILYGGSCKPSNAAELFACPDVDGGLIGGASLSSRDFVDIIKAI